MHLFGLVALGYMWCRMVEAAQAKLADGARLAKPIASRLSSSPGSFFMERMLPETARTRSPAPHRWLWLRKLGTMGPLPAESVLIMDVLKSRGPHG